MALLQNVIQRGTHASRPAAGSAGVLYFESDTCQLFRDNGSSWQLDDVSLIFTAKGQLLASSASAAVGALAAGSDGQVLTADSAQTLGIKWAAAGAAVPSFAWSTKTANYTLTTSDTGVLGDSTSGTITLTLPTAVGATALYTIKKKDSSAHTVTVATTSSQTIDGFSSVTLADQNQGALLASDGSNWYSSVAPAVTPAARVYNSANISVSNNTNTALTFDSERYDQGTVTEQHSVSSNTGRLVCQEAGVYLMSATVQWAANVTGSRDIYFRVNGSTFISADARGQTAAVNPYTTSQAHYSLAQGDYAECIVLQSSGGALNVVAAANFSPEFMWVKVA